MSRRRTEALLDVLRGEGSTDEMCLGTLQVAYDGEPSGAANRAPSDAATSTISRIDCGNSSSLFEPFAGSSFSAASRVVQPRTVSCAVRAMLTIGPSGTTENGVLSYCLRI